MATAFSRSTPEEPLLENRLPLGRITPQVSISKVRGIYESRRGDFAITMLSPLRLRFRVGYLFLAGVLLARVQ
jgi:hypothetical protein